MSGLIELYGASLAKAVAVHTVYVLVSAAIGFAAGLVCIVMVPVLEILHREDGHETD